MDNLQAGGKNDSFDLQEVPVVNVIDSRPPDNDTWSHFADFLAELIARHAEELDIDSWPDPHKVIMFQELQDVYLRFIQLSLQARKEGDVKLPLESKADIWYSPYIQISNFEEKTS